jgi:hypothetical protein
LAFLGYPRPLAVPTGRFFPMFISHPWTAFINPYYAWIVLNVAAWGVGCWAIYHLALKDFGSHCAFFSSLVMASAQGLIVYVAQPKVYVFAIAGIAVLLALQQQLFRPAHFRPAYALLFGTACALFLLTYESQPWLIGFLLIAYLRKYDLRWTLIAMIWAFSLYGLCNLAMNRLPQLETFSASVVSDPWVHIKWTIEGFHLVTLWKDSLRTLGDYGVVMIHAFGFCLAPALGGLWLLRSSPKRCLTLLAIALPGLLTYSYFDLGGSVYYRQFPRLVYSAYPLVYILAGFCLAKLAERRLSNRRPGLGIGLAVFAVVLNFAWLNADVFGCPGIYRYWFYRWPTYVTDLATPLLK